MDYAIFDITANLVDSYDNEAEAHAALERIAQQDPDAADGYALFAFDDDGQPVGDVLTAKALVSRS